MTGSVTYTTSTHFVQETGPILMSVVECSGQESNFLDCSYNSLLNSTCSHCFDVGIKREVIPSIVIDYFAFSSL